MYHNIPRAIIICIRIRIPPVLLKPKQILICRQKYHFRLNHNKYKLQQAPGQNFACEILKGQDLEIEDLASQRFENFKTIGISKFSLQNNENSTIGNLIFDLGNFKNLGLWNLIFGLPNMENSRFGNSRFGFPSFEYLVCFPRI